MAVITTERLSSILERLIADYPQFTFREGDVSRWSPSEKTIYFQSLQADRDLSTLFHEFGHAVCEHMGFEQDVSLLRMEQEAWVTGAQIAMRYDHRIDHTTIESALDSYRDWLHARSRCPTCSNPGIQSKKTGDYQCALCNTTWRTNDARQCGLKRYTV